MARYLGRYIAGWVGSGYLRGVGYTTTTNNRFPHSHAHPSLGPTNVIQMRTRNSSFVDFSFFPCQLWRLRDIACVCTRVRIQRTSFEMRTRKSSFVSSLTIKFSSSASDSWECTACERSPTYVV